MAALAPVVDRYLAPLLPLDALLFVWDHCLLDGWRPVWLSSTELDRANCSVCPRRASKVDK